MKIILKILLILISIPIVLVILYNLALFAVLGFNLDYSKIDSCLDRGMRWNDEKRYCEDGNGIEFKI